VVSAAAYNRTSPEGKKETRFGSPPQRVVSNPVSFRNLFGFSCKKKHASETLSEEQIRLRLASAILFGLWTLDFGLSKFEDDLLNQRGVFSTRYAEIII
jgi:hypothetical protein